MPEATFPRPRLAIGLNTKPGRPERNEVPSHFTSLRFLHVNANTILGSHRFDVAFHDLKNKLKPSTL